MKPKHFYYKIRHSIVFIGLASLAWLIFRSGTKPTRIIYPCQQTAITSSSIFLGSIIGSFAFVKKFRQDKVYRKKLMVGLSALLVLVGSGILAYDKYSEHVRLKKNELARQSWQQLSMAGEVKGVFTQAFPHPGRVVTARDTDATDWPGSSSTWQSSWGHYSQFVNQMVVDQMVEQGLRRLTQATSLKAAWQVLIPNFQPGQKIAIKVNQNNTTYEGYEDDNYRIDAIIHPVNSLIKGLKELGFQESDIWIYDATRLHPNRFTGGCLYSSVRFFDNYGGSYSGSSSNVNITKTTFNSTDPGADVNFTKSGVPDHQVADLLLDADYLINVPILKGHGSSAGVTFGFKNHFGSIDGGPSNLHDYTYPTNGAYYSPNYNPMVDIMRNPNINDKTVLILGDAIFGQYPSNSGAPKRWSTFNDDSPNMIFLSVDPVAIDSVMYDYFNRQNRPIAGSDDYLYLAAQAGLGVYESSSSFSYTKIDYIHLDLDQYTCNGSCLPNSCNSYNNCSTASGTCPSGSYCCQGQCGSIGQPNITLTKSAIPASVQLGQNINYTIHYHNTGTAAADEVVITDNIPTGVKFQTGSITASHSSAQCGFSNNTLSCSYSTIPAGAEGDIRFEARVE